MNWEERICVFAPHLARLAVGYTKPGARHTPAKVGDEGEGRP